MKTSTQILLCFFLILLSSFNSQPKEEKPIYILAGYMFDSEHKQLIKNQLIEVRDGKIKKITDYVDALKNKDIIDLSAYTVMPGLIDGHTHFLHSEEIGEKNAILNEILFESDAHRILRGAKFAKSWLMSGFTTVRDLGNSGRYLDIELKKAIKSNLTEGPRMFVSGPIISNVGGQVSGLSEEYHHLATKEYKIINGVEEAIKAVRENIHYGVDLIKICADNSPNNLELSFQEMKAIVDIAHKYNLKVTAHATTNRSAESAIMAGVDCIEHGYDLSISTLQLMQSKNVALVPTDKSGFLIKKYLMKMGSTGDLDGRVNNMQSGAKNRLALAREAGVTILVGSDNYINFDMPQGEAAKQVLIALEEEGMNPLDILQSATFLSARWMGMENQIGVLKEGCWADIIAVKNDLQNNFSESMNNVVFVMKEGRIYYKKL